MYRQKWILRAVVGKYCLGIKKSYRRSLVSILIYFTIRANSFPQGSIWHSNCTRGQSLFHFIFFLFLNFLCKAKCYKSSWKSHLNKICELWAICFMCIYTYLMNIISIYIDIHSFIHCWISEWHFDQPEEKIINTRDQRHDETYLSRFR